MKNNANRKLSRTRSGRKEAATHLNVPSGLLNRDLTKGSPRYGSLTTHEAGGQHGWVLYAIGTSRLEFMQD
jgi:hypothetical protein